MKRINIIIIVCSTALVSLRAQSVDEFITASLDYDPGLEAMKLEYQAAKYKADQMTDWPDPTINAAIGVLPIETRLGPQRFRVGVTQMIPWKGTLVAKKDLAQSQAEVLSTADKIAAVDIAYMIRQTYYQLQFLEARKEIISEKIEIVDGLIELTKSAVRSGKGPLSNVLLAERKKMALMEELEMLEIEQEQPTIKLNTWTGKPSLAPIVVSPLDTNMVVEEEVEVGEHPRFTALDLAVEASRSRISWTNYAVKPQIGVGLDYAFVSRRRDVDIPRNGRDILMPMGSIKIPIFTNRYDAIKQEERVKQEAITARSSSLMDRYNSEVNVAQSNIKLNQASINKSEKLKQITLETADLMRKEYAADSARFDELLKIEMEVLDFDMEILKAYYKMNLARAIILKFE